MVTVEVLHTAHVPPGTLVAVRRLLDEAFAGHVDDADRTTDPAAPHGLQAPRGSLSCDWRDGDVR